ncbi:thiaminase II [Paucilactobacillus suebicus]|uniref:Aminopyrimidine aminohydrolase n=1 Tax=Paucilactobacillus suebicus DSM 5007 = KCTC 3549 TaxID=1423807 RepID=A0A0R1W4I2_9LACO|nr:thiaminase II [Paucilactobacillus suebicus]KRM09436.1 TenA family transcriptional activator [Paucilactobacillus suebicus DSM 5007 = KCTC 3549]
MNFTNQLHEAAKPIWQASFDHPFIKEIANGTLPLDKFKFYLMQDRYYLEQFGDLHGEIANQISDPDIKQFLLDGAAGLHDGETDIRHTMFQELHLTDEDIKTTPIAPTAYDYVTHMNFQLNNAFPAAAVTALLPCYWLYSEIGQRLANVKSPITVYQQFLDSYSAADFENGTNQMIEIVGKMSEPLTDNQRDYVEKVFLQSSTYELHFWQMAYTKEHWPFNNLSA